jgi:hypothetical protein
MFHADTARCGRMPNAACNTFGYLAVGKGGTYATAKTQDFRDNAAEVLCGTALGA